MYLKGMSVLSVTVLMYNAGATLGLKQG
jgi:hypothetical protein